MAYFLFVDESGHDRRESPYEVLAGIAVEDRDVWNLIDAIKEAEERILGIRYARDDREIRERSSSRRRPSAKLFKASPSKQRNVGF